MARGESVIGAEPVDEWLDEVDENDVVLGQITKNDAWSTGKRIRVINAFVVNADGLIWVPRRTQHKTMFPNCLDVSVGGHVGAGESYEAAFKRETMEELNLNPNQLEWHEIASFSPLETTLSAFMRVYQISYESTPDYNRDDFSESFWLQPKDLERRILSGEPAKGDLLELVRLVYPKGVRA